MKCVCRERCYITSPSGKQRIYYEGDVEDFKKVPAHFEAVDESNENYVIDFATAELDELLLAKWKPSDLAKASVDLYEKEIEIPDPMDKEKMVADFLDARFRHVPKNPPV